MTDEKLAAEIERLAAECEGLSRYHVSETGTGIVVQMWAGPAGAEWHIGGGLAPSFAARQPDGWLREWVTSMATRLTEAAA